MYSSKKSRKPSFTHEKFHRKYHNTRQKDSFNSKELYQKTRPFHLSTIKLIKNVNEEFNALNWEKLCFQLIFFIYIV